MTQYWITLIYSLSPFVTVMFRNSIQDGMKFYYECQRFRPMMFWKVCTKFRIREAQLSKIEDNGEKEKRSEISITKL